MVHFLLLNGSTIGADGDPKRGISGYFEGEIGRLESGSF